MRSLLGLAVLALVFIPTATAETTFDSGNLAPGASFEYTFTEVMESGFFYTCAYHGSDDTMVHVVEDADGTTRTHTVSVTGANEKTVYSPQHLVIEVGDKVVWTNDSETHHTVTYDDAATKAAAGTDEHMGSEDPHDHDDHHHGETNDAPGVGLVLLIAGLVGLAARRRP